MRLSRTSHWVWTALVLALMPAGAANAQLFPPWGQQEPEQRQAPAGDNPPPQGVSRGENFSAGKSGAQLFASDCTGSGCHRGPQGLGKGRGAGTLASFLREHYTNSRESAVVLSNFLAGIGGEARPIQQPNAATPVARPPRSAARPDETAKPDEPRQRRPAAGEKPVDPRAKPQNPRTAQPVPAATPTAEPDAPLPAPAPAPVAPPPAPELPAPPPAPAKPAKPEFDIFD